MPVLRFNIQQAHNIVSVDLRITTATVIIWKVTWIHLKICPCYSYTTASAFNGIMYSYAHYHGPHLFIFLYHLSSCLGCKNTPLDSNTMIWTLFILVYQSYNMSLGITITFCCYSTITLQQLLARRFWPHAGTWVKG